VDWISEFPLGAISESIAGFDAAALCVLLVGDW
jgi:hypothetical protein